MTKVDVKTKTCGCLKRKNILYKVKNMKQINATNITLLTKIKNIIAKNHQ